MTRHHLLNHQRRPAGQPDHREDRRQRRRRHADGRRLRVTIGGGALVFGTPLEDPADTLPTPPRRSSHARHVHPRRARAGGLRALGLDLHQRRRRPVDAGSVTLAAGDPTVTCSITNDDQPVSLIIEKTVVNDDGGTATADDFGITTSAGALVFGTPVEDPADTFTYTATTLQVAPGTYTLAELGLAGYAPSAWTCTNGDKLPFDGPITLAAGDPTVTCSITNDDLTGAVLPETPDLPDMPDTDIGSGAYGSSPSADQVFRGWRCS